MSDGLLVAVVSEDDVVDKVDSRVSQEDLSSWLSSIDAVYEKMNGSVNLNLVYSELSHLSSALRLLIEVKSRLLLMTRTGVKK